MRSGLNAAIAHLPPRPLAVVKCPDIASPGRAAKRAPNHTDHLFQEVGYLPLLIYQTAAFNNVA
jgi:hypothetical protein